MPSTPSDALHHATRLAARQRLPSADPSIALVPKQPPVSKSDSPKPPQEPLAPLPFPPEHLLSKIAPEDLKDRTLMAICATLASLNNQALCVRELVDLCRRRRYHQLSGGTPAGTLNTSIRHHLMRCQEQQTLCLLTRHMLSGTPDDERLAPALGAPAHHTDLGPPSETHTPYTGPPRPRGRPPKQQNEDGTAESKNYLRNKNGRTRKGVNVWFLSAWTGYLNPFVREGFLDVPVIEEGPGGGVKPAGLVQVVDGLPEPGVKKPKVPRKRVRPLAGSVPKQTQPIDMDIDSRTPEASARPSGSFTPPGTPTKATPNRYARLSSPPSPLLRRHRSESVSSASSSDSDSTQVDSDSESESEASSVASEPPASPYHQHALDIEEFDLDFDFDFSNANDDLDDDEDDDDDDASTHTPITSPRSPLYFPDPSLEGCSKMEEDYRYGDPRIIDSFERFEWSQESQRLAASSLLIPPSRSPLSHLTLPVSAAELDLYALVPSPLSASDPKADPNAYLFSSVCHDEPMEDSFNALCDNDMTVVGESFDILGPESVVVDDLEFAWESTNEPAPSPITPLPVVGGPGFTLQRRYNPGMSVPIPPVCEMWRTRGTKRSEPDDSPELEMQAQMSPRERSASVQPPQTPASATTGFSLPPILTPFMPPIFNLSLNTPTTTTPPPPNPATSKPTEAPSPTPTTAITQMAIPQPGSPIPVVQSCQPLDPPIVATVIDGTPIFSMTCGSHTLMRRIDTDSVNLSVLKLVTEEPSSSSPTDATDSWIPLHEAQQLVSDGELKLPTCVTENFLSDKLADLFPHPLPQIRAVHTPTSSSARTTPVASFSSDSKLDLESSPIKEKVVVTSNTANRPIRQSRRASIAASKVENKPATSRNETTSRLRSASRASQPERLPLMPSSPSPSPARVRRTRASTAAASSTSLRSATHVRTRSGRRTSLAS